MNAVYNNIGDYDINRNKKIFIVFDEMIAVMNTHKEFQSIAKVLFIICKKLNISLVFIMQSYFFVRKYCY